MRETICILGAGAWGTALAVSWAQAGKPVQLIARNGKQASALNADGENKAYLPGITLPENLSILENLPHNAGVWVLAVPAQALRETVARIPADSAAPIVICSKGIERETGLLMSDVVTSYRPHAAIYTLSGPNFAAEVARGLPTASVIAGPDANSRKHLQQWLSTPNFRLYHSEDRVGAEIAGALKNVLAIACGIAQGMGLGENARAALITRGLAEIKRLALACGAKSETLAGLSGVGDIVLSCSSPTSRNMAFGMALGKGEAAETILKQRSSVVEGVPTAEAVLHLAGKLGIEMPICHAVHGVIHGHIAPKQALRTLLDRPLKEE